MSRATRRIAPRHVVFGLVVAGLGICAAAGAQAGDLGPPVYAPYPAPTYGGVYGGGPCHIVLDRGIDPYGREIVRRVRVCDAGPAYPPVAGPAYPPVAGPVYPPVAGPVVGPEYGYPAPRYYETQPSGYYGYPPRPPAPVGPGYYN